MFTNITKTTFDSVLTYNLVHSSMLVILYEVLLFVIGGIASLIFIFDDLFVGIAIMVLIIVIMIIFPFINKAMLKKFLIKAMDKSPIQDETTSNEFAFNNDSLEIISYKNQEVISNMRLEYKLIIKLIEFKDNLYIYVGVNLAHILEKQGMINGDFDELKRFLKDKLGQKYKVRKNIYF